MKKFYFTFGVGTDNPHRRLYDAMQTLNRKLIADINKGKR